MSEATTEIAGTEVIPPEAVIAAPDLPVRAGLPDDVDDDNVVLPDVPVPVSFAETSTPVGDYAKNLLIEAQKRRAEEKKKGGIEGIAVGGGPGNYMVNPYDIETEEGFNARDFASPAVQMHVDAIARDMAKNGYLTGKALVCTFEAGKLLLSDGECRLRAVFRAIEVYGAQFKAVPVTLEPRGTTKSDKVLNQIRRNGGQGDARGQRPFTPMEMARNFSMLISLGWSEAEIADRVGYSLNRVRAILDFQTKAPEEVKALVRDGAVSHTFAMEVVNNAANGVEATKLLTDAVEEAKAKGKNRATKKDAKAAASRNKGKADEGSNREVRFSKAAMQAIFEHVELHDDGKSLTLRTKTDMKRLLALLDIEVED